MKQTILMDDIEVVYSVAGDGDAVLLLHGWGCNHTTVKSISDAISDRYRVYSLDLPGFGESPEPKEIWGSREYVAMIESFVKALRIENPIFIGHSFGGKLSLIYGSQNRVSKIVLVGSAGVKPRRSLKYYLKVYSYKATKKLMPLLLGKKEAERRLSAHRTRVGSADYNAASDVMRGILVKVVNEDFRDLMPKITAPTLLMWGENDTATPMRDAKIMESLIPDCGLVVFRGCGHYSFLDDPYSFGAVLNKFL